MSGPPKLGDVVTVAAGSEFGSKPRPALALQSDVYEGLSTVTLALFTSDLTDTQLRPRFEPSPSNGLLKTSDLMVDLIVTARREKIGDIIGRLTETEMMQAEASLRIFLGLE